MWLLAWRNTIRRRRQSVLTVIITALTIFTFVVALAVYLLISGGLQLSQQRLGADIIVLPNQVNANVYHTLFTAEPSNIYMPESVVTEIRGIEGIVQASPQFFAQTLAAGCCSYGQEVRVVGYDPNTDFVLKPYFNEQHFDVLQDDEVIIGSRGDSALGNKMVILTQLFNVVGTLYPTGSGMDETIFLKIDVARKLARNIEDLAPVWAETPPEELVSSVLIKTAESADAGAVAAEINKRNLGVKAVAMNQTMVQVKQQMAFMGKVVFGLWLSSLLIAVLALIGRFEALAKERKKEIGHLRAMGIQRQQIFQLIIGEAGMMAFAGGFLGSIAACLCVKPILNFLQGSLDFPFGVWNGWMALQVGCLGLVLAVVLGFAASVYPASKSSKLDPQVAITQGEIG